MRQLAHFQSGKSEEAPFWRILAGLLTVLVFVLAIYLLNPARARAQAKWESVPVSVHAKATADYRIDEMNWSVPPVSMKMVEDTIKDQQVDLSSNQIEEKIDELYDALTLPVAPVIVIDESESTNSQDEKPAPVLTPAPTDEITTQPVENPPAQTPVAKPTKKPKTTLEQPTMAPPVPTQPIVITEKPGRVEKPTKEIKPKEDNKPPKKDSPPKDVNKGKPEKKDKSFESGYMPVLWHGASFFQAADLWKIQYIY